MTEDILEQQRVQQAQLIAEEIDESLKSLAYIKISAHNKALESKIFGKTLDEWQKQLSIKIDPGADPSKIKYYASELSNALEIAYGNLNKSKAMYQKYKLSYLPNVDASISKQATSKVRKVPPKLDTMEAVARNELGDRAIAVLEFENLIEFWQSMIFKLKDQINLVTIANIANGTLNKIGSF